MNLYIDYFKVYILEGANGSGKTTFCRILSCLEKNFQGRLTFFGKEIQRNQGLDISQKLCYIKQEADKNIIALTPDEDLLVWQNKFLTEDDHLKKKERIEALTYFDVIDCAHTPYWKLSYGQKKRISLASLIINKQKFWVLDEPDNGIDKEGIKKIVDLINERKVGALIVTHKKNLYKKLNPTVLRLDNLKIIS